MRLLVPMISTPAWKILQAPARVPELVVDRIVLIHRQIQTIWLSKAMRGKGKQERFIKITAEFQSTLSSQSRSKARTECNLLEIFLHQLVVAQITCILWLIWCRTKRSTILAIQNYSRSSTSSWPIRSEWSTFLRWTNYVRRLSRSPNSWTSRRKGKLRYSSQTSCQIIMQRLMMLIKQLHSQLNSNKKAIARRRISLLTIPRLSSRYHHNHQILSHSHKQLCSLVQFSEIRHHLKDCHHRQVYLSKMVSEWDLLNYGWNFSTISQFISIYFT